MSRKFSEFSKQEKMMLYKQYIVFSIALILTLASFMFLVVHVFEISIKTFSVEDATSLEDLLLFAAVSLTIIIYGIIRFCNYLTERLGFYTPYDLEDARKRVEKIQKKLENEK